MKHPLQEAVALAKFVPFEEIESAKRHLKLVSEQVDQGLTLKDNMLGIENTSMSKIEKNLSVLTHEQTELKNRVNFGEKYRLLSMEPLKWRDKKGLPQLVIFSLDSPIFEIKVKWLGGNKTMIFPKLPDVIATNYKDVITKLKRLANKHWQNMKISCRFDGLIPEEVKQKITEAKDDFKQMFLIAEPNGFKQTKIKRDPLIVGFDGSQLWLIAVFDVTPVEAAMYQLTVKDRHKDN